MKVCPICASVINDNVDECPSCHHHFDVKPKKECPRCHETVDASLGECPRCGYNFNEPKKECPKCHEMIDASMDKCPRCGYNFNKKIPIWLIILIVVLCIFVFFVMIGIVVLAVIYVSMGSSSDGKPSKSMSSSQRKAAVSSSFYDKSSSSSKKEESSSSEKEIEVDVESILDEINAEELISELKEDGDVYNGNTEEIIKLAVQSGNYQVANWEESKDSTLKLTEKKKGKLKLSGSGSCILDDSTQIYENKEFILVSAPTFYGTINDYEYSGIIDVLMAKVPYEGYDYMPLYVDFSYHEYKDIYDATVSSKKKGNGATKLHDSDLSTYWQTANGEGESVTIVLSHRQKVNGIMIANGCRKSENDFYKYGRASKVRVRFGDEKMVERNLNTELGCAECISADGQVKTDTITIYIDKTVKGNKSDSLAVSEIYVY